MCLFAWRTLLLQPSRHENASISRTRRPKPTKSAASRVKWRFGGGGGGKVVEKCVDSRSVVSSVRLIPPAGLCVRVGRVRSLAGALFRATRFRSGRKFTLVCDLITRSDVEPSLDCLVLPTLVLSRPFKLVYSSDVDYSTCCCFRATSIKPMNATRDLTRACQSTISITSVLVDTHKAPAKLKQWILEEGSSFHVAKCTILNILQLLA